MHAMSWFSCLFSKLHRARGGARLANCRVCACAGLKCQYAHGAKEVRREAAVLKGLLPADYKCTPRSHQPTCQSCSATSSMVLHLVADMHLQESAEK